LIVKWTDEFTWIQKNSFRQRSGSGQPRRDWVTADDFRVFGRIWNSHSQRQLITSMIGRRMRREESAEGKIQRLTIKSVETFDGREVVRSATITIDDAIPVGNHPTGEIAGIRMPECRSWPLAWFCRPANTENGGVLPSINSILWQRQAGTTEEANCMVLLDENLLCGRNPKSGCSFNLSTTSFGSLR